MIMEKLTWDVVALLLVRYGIPTADAIVKEWLSGTPVTKEKWDAIRAIASLQARDLALQALTDAGIDPNSERAKTLLSLVG